MKINSLKEYFQHYDKSKENPAQFWSEIAEEFTWKKKWTEALEWNFTGPDVKWFINGKLNITENCLDRHLDQHGDDVAIIWEPNDPNSPTVRMTYRELHQQVCQFSNAMQ